MRKLVALLILSCIYIVAINYLWLFLMVPLVGLQCVNVVFPDHTHLFVNVLCNAISLIGPLLIYFQKKNMVVLNRLVDVWL